MFCGIFIENCIMKLQANFYLALTTGVLLLVVLIATLQVAYAWVFYATVVGQSLLLVTVFKVLKAPCTSQKTFDEFYEDYNVRK